MPYEASTLSKILILQFLLSITFYEYPNAYFKRTRQIIRYRATATLRRPQKKAICSLKIGGGLQNQQEHQRILTKYEAVHPTAVSENNSSSGMLII